MSEMNIFRTTTKIIASALVLTFVTTGSVAQTWEVSTDKANITNPLAGDATAIEAGKTLYMQNCKACHGDPGKNNGLPLPPNPPIDPASEQMQAQTHGALFFKVTEGRGAMTSFANTLTEEKRWQVVSYMKSLADAPLEEIEEYQGATVELSMSADIENKSISAKLIGTQDKAPAGGVELGLYAKRTFGDQLIAKTKKTDANGTVIFNFPEGIKCDAEGNLVAAIKTIDQNAFPNVWAYQNVPFGDKIHPENLLDKRSLWTVSKNAPLWLIFSYLGMVMGVWSFIGYIGFLIFKIYKAGQQAA